MCQKIIYVFVLVVLVWGLICLKKSPTVESLEEQPQSKEEIVVEKQVVYKEEIPPVRPIFQELEIDLQRYYFTEEEITKMEKEDEGFANPEHYGQNNQSWEFKSKKGDFLVVRSYGRQSINPKARNRGGWGYSTLRLPSGQWMSTYFQIQKVLDLGSKTFWICDHGIYEFVSSEKVVNHVSFEGLDGKWAPFISTNRNSEDGLFSNYLPVNKSCGSEFGGLLQYEDGKWTFHRYEGKGNTWVEETEEKEGGVILTLFNGWDHLKDRPTPKIQFSPKEGFKDL